MRAALIQMTSSDRPEENLRAAEAALRQAAAEGADFAATPETTNLISVDRAHALAVTRTEGDDPTLARLRAVAAELGLWTLIGSLAVRCQDDPARLANRSFLIAPDGAIAARYDKIHMFDVEIGDGQTYRESDTYRPGTRAVLADMPFARLGLTICYDLRFPALFRDLAQAGAQIVTVPAAFTVPTGRAHWHTLLRARAIETGAFVLAPAQTGTHPARGTARPRQTFGHSLAIAPWGETLADAGDGPGVTLVELDLARVTEARTRIPALRQTRDWTGPDIAPAPVGAAPAR
jgi:predicted amidohydrolase